MIVSRSIVNECINCGLRYMLAQPIEIDATMLIYFLVQFTGVFYVMNFLASVKESFLFISQPETEESLSGVLTPSVVE